MTHEPKTSKRRHRSASRRPRWMPCSNNSAFPRATRSRLETLSRYEQIIAPFTGVVTKRYADTGSLIQAGQDNNTQTLPVVQVAESDLLRLRMPVPESDVPYIQVGGDVQVKVNATGRTFTGKIVRFSRALDTNTRTMLTEVDVPNRDLSLSPGMYAETTIQLQQKNDALILPAQAVVQNGDPELTCWWWMRRTMSRSAIRDSGNTNLEPSGDYQRPAGWGQRDRRLGRRAISPGEVVSPHAAFIPTAAQEVSE